MAELSLLQKWIERDSKATPRLRLLLFGDSFCGKTIVGCRLPDCLYVDADIGSDWYQKQYQPERVKVRSFDAMVKLLGELTKEDHCFRTIYIDGLTKLWHSLCEKWKDRYLESKKDSKGHKGDWYEMSMLEWGPVKGDWNGFVHRLKGLDCNVIYTARSKAIYEKRGRTIQQVGSTYDLPENFRYEVDAVVRLFAPDEPERKGKAGLIGRAEYKERTSRFPSNGLFSFSMENLLAWFGEDIIGRMPGVHIDDVEREQDKT